MKKELIIAAVFVCAFTKMSAFDFESDGIFYSVIDDERVAIESCDESFNSLQIPEQVSFNGSVYAVAEIGKHAFKKFNISEVDIPESVTNLRTQCFTYSAVKNVIIPNSVETIASFAFYGSDITSLKAGDNLQVIGRLSFADCSKLEEIWLGSNIEKLDSYSFNNCTSLKNVYIGAMTPPEVGFHAFYKTDVSFCNLFVPRDAVEAYKEIEFWDQFNICPLPCPNEEPMEDELFGM